MDMQVKIEKLRAAPKGKLGERVLSELDYALELSRVEGGRWEQEINGAVGALDAGLAAEGVITDGIALSAEQLLLPMQAAAKRYTVLCVGHAHIDMNWMWRYDETVSITLDTFRTVLSLLAEYPEFRFSQSQASVYEIVEAHDPDMLEEIRRYVAEGRWELTASTWVEADRNMPSGESMARHLLYTKRYLKRLVGAQDEDFLLDFEPDTFGHNANVPEILSQGGVKYYYHCRGDRGKLLFRWQSPSGASILCYREPHWYLGPIGADFALSVPSFCAEYGMDTHMRVYGVGDHGGGPTRRDIERLLDMAEWPIFPQMRFGSHREFFEKAEQATGLDTVQGELNYIFTGCYTSQARITQANRFGEAKLDESEKFAALASRQAGMRYAHTAFEGAWRKVLFNQFHDILPGSGVIDTREYAMGIFSQAVAAADTQKSKALRALGALADTSAYASQAGMADSISEGAGVGFGVGYGMAGLSPTNAQGASQPFRIAQTGRGRGINRVFHIFNPSAVARNEVVELTLFDWPGNYDRLRVLGADGAPLRFQRIDREPNAYWQHRYVRLLVEAPLPACGRYACVVTEDNETRLPLPPLSLDVRVEEPYAYALENACLKATFSPDTGALVSLFDKTSEKELLSGPSAFFRLIDEQPAEKTAGTSWTVGRYRSVHSMTDDVCIRTALEGPLKNAIVITTRAGASTVTYTVSLAENARWLDIDCDVDWRHVGTPKESTPQLNFTLPLAAAQDRFVQDIPGGLLQRLAVSQDVPCQSFAAAETGGGRAAMLMSDSKYGFRCEAQPDTGGCVISLDCLRSSTDPDPYPEFGRHHFRIGIGVASADGLSLLNTAYAFCHPATAVSDQPRKGSRPMQESLLQVDGAFLQAVKVAEDDGALVIRLVETEGKGGTATVRFGAPVQSAMAVDVHEQALPGQNAVTVAGNTLRCALRANGTISLKVYFT